MSEVESLSTSRIAAAKATDKDLWLSDSDGKRGFGRLMLRVQPNGAKHFYFRICQAGRRRMVALGPYSKDAKQNHLTLKQAREAAHQVLTNVRSASPTPQATGAPHAVTPRAQTLANEEQEQAQQAVVEPSPPTSSQGTLDELCAAYVDHLFRHGRISATETGNRFRRHLYGTPFGQSLAAQVTSKAVAVHLRALVEANKGRTAALLRSSMSAAFALALKVDIDPGIGGDYSRFGVVMNPVLQSGSLARFSKPRRRKLTPSELGLLRAALDSALSDPKQVRVSDRFLRVTLFLGGHRCAQLARVRTVDVDCDNWMIQLLDPKGRRESPREHHVPVSTFAKSDIQWLLSYAKDVGSPFLFPGKVNTSQPMSFEVAIARAQKLSQQLHKANGIPAFGYSDFRRTTQTQMTALGISEEVSNQIRSHELGGVAKRHYNSYAYEVEMREALEKWGAYLVSLQPASSKS